MEVQIFGVKKSSDTRKALRFFAERRIKTHFVDLTERAAAPGELKRFIQRFGLSALIDKAFELKLLRLHAERLADIVLTDPEVRRGAPGRLLTSEGGRSDSTVLPTRRPAPPSSRSGMRGSRPALWQCQHRPR